MQQSTTDTESVRDADSAGEPALHVSDLRKTDGSEDDSGLAIDDVSVDGDRDCVVGALGPNDAEKTTAIKSIFGIVSHTEGAVEIAGGPSHNWRIETSEDADGARSEFRSESESTAAVRRFQTESPTEVSTPPSRGFVFIVGETIRKT